MDRRRAVTPVGVAVRAPAVPRSVCAAPDELPFALRLDFPAGRRGRVCAEGDRLMDQGEPGDLSGLNLYAFPVETPPKH